jgi:hypothetical protein
VKGRWEELAVDGDGPGDAQTRVTAARQTQIRRVTQPRANVRPRAAGHDAARRRCDSIHRRQRPARGAPNVGGRRLRAASRERPVGHSVASVATAPAAIARVDRWADAVAHESAAVAAGPPVTGRTWDSLGARWAGPGGHGRRRRPRAARPRRRRRLCRHFRLDSSCSPCRALRASPAGAHVRRAEGAAWILFSVNPQRSFAVGSEQTPHAGKGRTRPSGAQIPDFWPVRLLPPGPQAERGRCLRRPAGLTRLTLSVMTV